MQAATANPLAGLDKVKDDMLKIINDAKQNQVLSFMRTKLCAGVSVGAAEQSQAPERSWGTIGLRTGCEAFELARVDQKPRLATRSWPIDRCCVAF